MDYAEIFFFTVLVCTGFGVGPLLIASGIRDYFIARAERKK